MSADDLIIGDDFAQTFGPTDTDRASWALSAIKTYAAWTRQSLEGQPIAGSTAEELIVDLLGDLRRLIDTLGLRADFDQLSERGQPRYSANRPDEAPPAPDDAAARGGRRDLATGTRVQLISCKDRHAYVQPRTLVVCLRYDLAAPAAPGCALAALSSSAGRPSTTLLLRLASPHPDHRIHRRISQTDH